MFYNTLRLKDKAQKALKEVEKLAKRGLPEAPSPPPSRQGFEPSETLLKEEQERMLVRWCLYGIHALPEYVADLTRAQANQAGFSGAHSRHRHILDDCDDRNGGSGLLLLTMPRDLVEAIIKGDVPYRVDNDVRFRLLVEKYCRLRAVPGVYLNVIARRRFNDETHEKRPNSGCGLSWKELKKVVERIEQEYLMPSVQIGVAEFQNLRETDQTFPMRGGTNKTRADYREGFRRYCPSDNARKVLLEFVGKVKQIWLKDGQALFRRQPSDARLDIPMRRCFQEVGWGADVFGRASQHPSHIATNYVNGLFHATITRLYPGVFEMRRYQVLRVVGQEYASLSECLISQLASSYWYLGGLNPTLAGNCPDTGRHQRYFEVNAKAVSESSLYKDNLTYQKDLVVKSNDMIKWFETFDANAAKEDFETKLWALVKSHEQTLVQTEQVVCRWAVE